jgi:hypothetical protein
MKLAEAKQSSHVLSWPVLFLLVPCPANDVAVSAF